MLSSAVTEWKGRRRQGQTLLKGALGRDETSGIWELHLDIGKTYFWFVFCLVGFLFFYHKLGQLLKQVSK